MDQNPTYTAYIVRDVIDRRYLNAPTYTGRRPRAWGRIGEAHLFHNRVSASRCASDINRRGPGSKRAEVVPVQMYRLPR